jgi:hypothetical protein
MENKWTEQRGGEGDNNKTMRELAEPRCKWPACLLMQQRAPYGAGSMLNSAFHYGNRGSLSGMSRHFSRYGGLNSASQARGRTIYTHYLSFIKV